ncbi:MAG: hypothetical protein KJ905_01360, partial [Nanoarchaeota archaeon]|nr:hypothetical protein [Nanoarchaeota archaeon]
MQQLENLAYASPRTSEVRQKVYVVGDLERMSAVSLNYGGGSSGSSAGGGSGLGGFIVRTPYQDACEKGPSGGSPKPASIGTFSDFQKEGVGNISRNLALGKFAQEAEGSFLKERYDASGHNDSGIHLNQDLTDYLDKILNSGKSKKSEDGWKGLGPAHFTNLFDSK